MNELIITGAITNTYSKRARKHAYSYYEYIRKNHSDVDRIVANTNFTKEEILKVKNYIFIELHNLEENGIRQFFPCFEIAQSWQRLAFDPKNIQPHDITLIRHELLEISLIQDQHMSQQEAHNEASMYYNYQEESAEYYKSLDIKQNSKNKDEYWQRRG